MVPERLSRNIAVSDVAARDVAVERAFKTERKRVLDFIRRRVPSEEDAEDILQDVFYQLAAGYSVEDPIEKMASWLFTVARNKITDLYRKRKPDPLPSDPNDPTVALNIEELLNDPSQNPEDSYWRTMVTEELDDALDELPDDQRDVFIMHEMEGRSFKEIAEITGEPLNTLLSRKRYAVLHLRERLKELYGDLVNV